MLLVLLIFLDFVWTPAEVKPYDGKVLSVLWSTYESPHNLFSCGPEGIMIWWKVRRDVERKTLHLDPLHHLCLPPSKQRWASAVDIVPILDTQHSKDSCVLVCGDRKGSIHLFDPTGLALDKVIRCVIDSLPSPSKSNNKTITDQSLQLVLTTNHLTTKLTNQNHDQRHKYHHLMKTLHLTLKMTTAQVVKMVVTSNSLSEDYTLTRTITQDK